MSPALSENTPNETNRTDEVINNLEQTLEKLQQARQALHKRLNSPTRT